MKKPSEWLIWSIIIVITVIGVIYFMSNNKHEKNKPIYENTSESIGELVERYKDQGKTHISLGNNNFSYNSNPPTSGPHEKSANWGFYDRELPDEKMIHNLEHGGIWISYKNISSEEINDLKNLAKTFPKRLIITKRKENDTAIAVASWTRLMKLDKVDKGKIVNYIKQYTNKSPEPLAR